MASLITQFKAAKAKAAPAPVAPKPAVPASPNIGTERVAPEGIQPMTPVPPPAATGTLSSMKQLMATPQATPGSAWDTVRSAVNSAKVPVKPPVTPPPPPPPTPGAVPMEPVQGGVQPMAPVAPPVSPVGGMQPVMGASVSRIDPTNDLRSTAITPDGSGPDRTALAQQKFRDLMAGLKDEHKVGTEQIGRDAAKFGRIGMGGVATSVGNLADTFKRRELEAANSLASDVANDDILDRARNRAELRGERDYQYGAGRDATSDRVQQRLLEEQLLNGRFGRAATATQLGYQGNPSGVQSATGQSYANDASGAFDDAGELMRLLAMRKQTQGQPGLVGSNIPKPTVLRNERGVGV